MSMRIRAASRARRLAALSLGLAALVLVPTVASVGQTEAAWVNGEHATTTIATPTVTMVKGTCQLSNPNLHLAGNQVATLNFSFPAASATVVQPSRILYTVRSPNGTTSEPVAVAVTNGAPTSLAFNTNQAAAGTYVITITPNRNTWSTGSTTSWDGTAISYTLVITQNALLGRYWSSCA